MKTIGLITANYNSDKFGPLTENRPLASVPFAGRYRLMDFALSNMVNSGITKVGIITPYNSGSVIDHVGAGKPWSLDRKKDGLFMMPGSVYGIHTAGNRFLLRDIINNKAFFIRSDADYVILSGCSDIYNLDYNEMIKHHAKSGAYITVLYKKIDCTVSEDNGYYLDIDKNDQVNAIYKNSTPGMNNLFMDCFIINKDFLEDFVLWYGQLEYKDIFEIIMDNVDKFAVSSFEFKGYLGKIDDINDYVRVCNDIKDYDIRNELFHTDNVMYTKVQDDAPVIYRGEGHAVNSIISAGCSIEGNVVNSTVFRSTKVGKNASIKDSVVMMYCEIGEGAVLENVICDKFVKVSPGARIIGSPEKPIVIPKGAKI